MEKKATKLQVKRAEIDVLEVLFNKLDSMAHDNMITYCVIGKEEEQATDWKTGELLWEDDDHTIPKYRDAWGERELSAEEMTPEILAKADAIKSIKMYLEKLI